MIRQRVHTRRLRLADVVGRVLVTALGLALGFYGVMVILAALKVSPTTIDHVSAYRTIQHALEAIDARNITGRDRIIVAVAGLIALALFAPLTWRALPRPYLARTRLLLDEPSQRGDTEIKPRALERAAEIAAATRDPRVVGAWARSDGGGLDLHVELEGLDAQPLGPLREIQQRVRSTLAQQGFPPVDVDVTLTGAALTPRFKETTS